MHNRPHPNDRAPPPPPDSLVYVLRYFSILNRGRPIGPGGSMLPIPPSEIDAAARLLGIRFTPWELDTLLILDDVWRAVMSKKAYTFDDEDEESDDAS